MSSFTARNIIILVFKQFTYAEKCIKEKPTFLNAIGKVILFHNIEKYIAIKNDKIILNSFSMVLREVLDMSVCS